MGRLRQAREKKNEGVNEINKQCRNLDVLAEDAQRVADVARNASVIINDLDLQFKKATKLNDLDIKFLLLATALQCLRQYVIGSITQRVDDKTAAKKTAGHNVEHSDRHHQLYNPSLNEILTNPVPFDTTFGSKDFGLGIGGGFNHRASTLGHDPILGWIFGTMNIATSTITIAPGLQSFHVQTGFKIDGRTQDKITKHADTWKVLSYSKDKLLNEGIHGKEIIGASIMKEAIHLKSDMYSTASLPLPIVSAISVETARNLANYGLDMGNVIKVGSQAGFAMLINSLISMIHGLYYDESQYSSWNLYSVKTRRLIMYSNVIATSSNVVAVGIAGLCGCATGNIELIRKSLNYLDIGGIVVAITQLFKNRKFIEEVKREFLEKEFYNIVMGNLELED